jgi:4a-hydroxytetrahydrobiopterin dehydratase
MLPRSFVAVVDAVPAMASAGPAASTSRRMRTDDLPSSVPANVPRLGGGTHADAEVRAWRCPRAGPRSRGRCSASSTSKTSAAINFVNRLAEVAETASHHPDISIHWNRVVVRWWTQAAQAITDRDAELAAQTDGLAKG